MTIARKVLASLAAIAVAAGLMAFGTLGSFDDTRDHFPQTVTGTAD